MTVDTNGVRDFLTLVAVGLAVGGTLFGLTWRLVVRPHLQLYVLNPIESIRKELRRELHTNGGSSLKDRVEATNRVAQEALDIGKTNKTLMEGIHDRLDFLERRRDAR